MGSPTKTGFIRNVLNQLGIKPPSDDALDDALREAARSLKADMNLAVGTEVTFELEALPGSAGSESAVFRDVSAHMARSLLHHLGHTTVRDEQLKAAVIGAAREYKKELRIDPGPEVNLSFYALPAESEEPRRSPVPSPKVDFLVRVLSHLDYPKPDANRLQAALVSAAREVKGEMGVDPGPAQRLVMGLSPRNCR